MKKQNLSMSDLGRRGVDALRVQNSTRAEYAGRWSRHKAEVAIAMSAKEVGLTVCITRLFGSWSSTALPCTPLSNQLFYTQNGEIY
jgi:hypothetical protein